MSKREMRREGFGSFVGPINLWSKRVLVCDASAAAAAENAAHGGRSKAVLVGGTSAAAAGSAG